MKPQAAFRGHTKPAEEKRTTDTLSGLLEYAQAQFQEKIDKLKELKPNTLGYEALMADIDNFQEKLATLRRQLAGK